MVEALMKTVPTILPPPSFSLVVEDVVERRKIEEDREGGEEAC